MARGFIRVTLVFQGDEKTIKSIYDSLHPDNVVVPDYLGIEETLNNEEYTLVFKGELRGRVIDSIKQSVDEVLAITDMLSRSLDKICKQGSQQH